jgi:hypothetical protein
MSPGPRFWMRAAARLLARPRLWPTALAQSVRLAAPGWWRHAPYLPFPDPEYVRFRLETQYGSAVERDRPDPDDLVVYLEWCAAMARSQRRRRDTRG